MRGWIGALVLTAAVAGCAPSSPNPATAPVPAAPQGPPPPAGVIAGPLGVSLSEGDRQTAFEAQIDALDKGQRKSWKGKAGVFGYVEPGAELGACRNYTHTVYLDGRPQSAKGAACRQPDGNWRFEPAIQAPPAR
jgi:surface antigen